MFDFGQLLEVDLLLQVYLMLMVLDFVTGFLKAWRVEGFKSRKIRDGVIRVVGELVALLFVSILSQAMAGSIAGAELMITGAKVLFVFKEGISIGENLEEIGVILPPFIRENLQVFKDKFVPKGKDEEDKKDTE